MSERWKPERDDIYWFFNGLNVNSFRWCGDSVDVGFFESGNCFKTEAEAQAAAEKAKALLLSLHEPATDRNRLPKLTAEVFDHPDCPKWAKWAAVDYDGEVRFHQEKPTINSLSDIWWYRYKKFLIIFTVRK